MMSILSVHNRYQHRGGEDQVVASEAELLELRGHTVTRYEEDNRHIDKGGVRIAHRAIWNQRSVHRIRGLSPATPFDVAHFHNTFPLISPSGYYAARSEGIPVVQTLHNYRLICPGATLSRDGSACESCLDHHTLLPSIIHGCYRDSRPATVAIATMLAVHRLRGTYRQMVDAYIALSEFARKKFIAGGLPAERIAVKPNFLSPDPGIGDGRGGFALFVGRLSEEKGIRVLAEAWRHLSDIPIVVAGEGPLSGTVVWPAGVTTLGGRPHAHVLQLMREASLLIFPSMCYENAPMTIVEALACGLPVIASDLGSIPEFVTDRRTGLLFRPGDPEDLARQVRWAFDHPEEMRAMRVAARREYEEKYTGERNYKMLMEVYKMAIENARSRHRAAS
jgi:glycosyltransferase involved in cell wall biosynthesis